MTYLFLPTPWPALRPEEQIVLLEGPLFLASPVFSSQLGGRCSFQFSSAAARSPLVPFPGALCTSLTHSVGFLSPFL